MPQGYMTPTGFQEGDQQPGWVPVESPPLPTEAETAATVRKDRTARLAACDWTQLADAPLTPEQLAAWAAYRQALRDVPEQEGFPVEVVWPAKP